MYQLIKSPVIACVQSLKYVVYTIMWHAELVRRRVAWMGCDFIDETVPRAERQFRLIVGGQRIVP
ncbi:hypothetical protein MY11210_009672, partial [Beauveria gryllotalpidicola]